MKTLQKLMYWSIFTSALMTSILMYIKETSTNFLVIVIFALIACLGYYTQEKFNDWMEKTMLEKVRNIFKVKGLKPPTRIEKFRRFVTGVAITCFWGAIGIDFTTMFISGSTFNGKIHLPLYDLSVFLFIISLMPEIFWTFNYGVNDAVKGLEKK
jgi:hypothetical protein